MNKNKKSARMGEEAIIPLLFKLSIPSIIAMSIQALYNVVDSIYVGRLSTDALSALSLAFPIQLIIIGIGVGTGIGTSSLISRLLGQGDNKKAANVAEHVILLSAIYGVVVAIIGAIFAKDILQLFTDNHKLISIGSEYIRIILVGSFAMFLPMIANNILRGEGNTFTPMIAMLIGSVLNIIIDPIFIFGLGFMPKLGVAGAAYATVLARLLSGAFLIYILFSDKNELKINMKSFEFEPQIIFDVYKVGLPAMFMQFLASFMLGGMNRILAEYSATAIAAAGIYFRLQSFVFMPVFGLNQGYMPIIGYNYGHYKPERMKKAIKSTVIVAFSFTTAGFILFQTIPELLISMFNSDPELIRIGTSALKKISLAFPIIGPAIIISTTFQALGKGFPSLLFSFLRQIVILLPVMYFFGKWFGLNNLWYAFPLSEVISIIPASIWLIYILRNIFKRMRAGEEEVV